MAERRANITLKLDDNFTARLGLIAAAAHDMHLAQALAAATWEPHDWSDF